MERLTEYHGGKAVIKNKSKLGQAMEKLAKYEDIEEQKRKAEELKPEIIRSHMNEKEKVTSAEIVSHEVYGKTYYAIKYKEVGKDYYTVGYGSYKLDYVVCWLNEYFEFCGEAKVVVGVGKDTNIPSNDGWIPVEDGLPEEGEEVEVTIEEMADSASGMRYYTKTAWVQEERWVIKRNPYNPRVIAWRPLPEPYKPKKLQTEEKPVQ